MLIKKADINNHNENVANDHKQKFDFLQKTFLMQMIFYKN